jgi:hypothetical protein
LKAVTLGSGVRSYVHVSDAHLNVPTIGTETKP